MIRFLRHGLTVSNEAHRYLGRLDEGLSEKGRALLAEQFAGREKEMPGGLLFVSPMRRCRETAELLFPGRDGICIPEWTEIDFGEFEGKCYEELKDDAAYQAWLVSGGRMPFPQGESREAFIARSMRGYERMLAYVRGHLEALQGQDRSEAEIGQTAAGAADNVTFSVTAVVNGGTIMAVCSNLFGGDYFDYQIGCGGEYLCPSVHI